MTAVRDALTKLMLEAELCTWGPYRVVGFIGDFRDREHPATQTPIQLPIAPQNHDLRDEVRK